MCIRALALSLGGGPDSRQYSPRELAAQLLAARALLASAVEWLPSALHKCACGTGGGLGLLAGLSL